MNFNVSAKEASNTTVQCSQVQKKDDDNAITWFFIFYIFYISLLNACSLWLWYYLDAVYMLNYM